MAPRSPLDAVADLQAIVAQLAPTLRPQVLPRGFHHGLDVLLNVCATDEEKMALLELIHERTPLDAKQHGHAPCAIGAFDAAQREFVVESVKWLSDDEALVHEFPRFLELQLNDTEKAQEVISLFLAANGHKAEDTMAAQQCFNAAFALQTLLRAFPVPPISINSTIIDSAKHANVPRAIIDALFPKKQKAVAQKNKTNNGDDTKSPPTDNSTTKKSKKRKANSKQ